MAISETTSQKIENIVNKIDDLRRSLKLFSNNCDEFTPPLNCIERLLLDIQKDVAGLAEIL